MINREGSMKKALFMIVLLCVTGISTSLYAQDVEPKDSTISTTLESRQRPKPESYGTLLLKMVLGMLAVVILAYVVIRYGLKRFMPSSQQSSHIEVVLRQPIEPRRALLVVKVASKHVLLASSEQGISFLTELEDVDADMLTHTSSTQPEKLSNAQVSREFSLELEDPIE